MVNGEGTRCGDTPVGRTNAHHLQETLIERVVVIQEEAAESFLSSEWWVQDTTQLAKDGHPMQTTEAHGVVGEHCARNKRNTG